MSKAFSTHEKELIRNRLLIQGYKLFSAYGLKKTNIDEIAKAAGISKGAFYSFYDSKEALFMDVIEMAEQRVRQQVFDTIDLPGDSPRARLFAVLQKAFSMFKDIPILQFVTGSDYEMLFRRIPPEKLRTHLSNDQVFIHELFTRCQQAGIPIQVQPEKMVPLLYPLALTIIHEDDFGTNAFGGSIGLLLELIAAYCLGEVEMQLQPGKEM
jgi:AcrR family transcriptional regulator